MFLFITQGLKAQYKKAELGEIIWQLSVHTALAKDLNSAPVPTTSCSQPCTTPAL